MFDSISKVENGPNIFSISKKPIQHTVKLLNLMRTKSKSNRMRETNHTNQSYVTSLVAFDSIFFWYALNSRVSLYNACKLNKYIYWNYNIAKFVFLNDLLRFLIRILKKNQIYYFQNHSLSFNNIISITLEIRHISEPN